MILCDAGPLVALVDRNDPYHAASLSAAAGLPKDALLTTLPCFTEAMYLGHRKGGHEAQAALWRLREAGRLILHPSTPAEVDRMAVLMLAFRDVPMDFADASLVATAECLSERRIFTFDRHFWIYRLMDGTAMQIVP